MIHPYATMSTKLKPGVSALILQKKEIPDPIAICNGARHSSLMSDAHCFRLSRCSLLRGSSFRLCVCCFIFLSGFHHGQGEMTSGRKEYHSEYGSGVV
jgi:hypothetical protein